MNKRNMKNDLNTYKIGGGRRAGIFSDYPLKREKEENPADKDKENRTKVIKQIEKYISEGKTLDEALDCICPKNEEDEYINTEYAMPFEYLTKNGLDIRNIFKSWYESYQKRLNRPINWVTGGSKNANFEEIGEDDGSR